MLWFLAANIVLVVAAVLFFGKWSAFVAVLRAISPAAILTILALALANYLLRSLRYWLLNRWSGILLGFRESTMFYIAGFSFSVTPGKVGELVRIWLIRESHDYPIRQLAPPVFVDRVCDLVAALILCALTIAIFADQALYLAVAGVAILSGFACLLSPRLSIGIITAAARLAGGRRLRLFASLRRMVRQVARLLRPGRLMISILLSLAAWTAEAWALKLCLSHVGVEIAFAHAVFIFSFANLIGALSFVPGGLGGTEAIMVGLMVSLGAPVETAFAVTLLIRACTLWFGVILGLGVSVALASGRREALRQPA
jgi:glycosyltransferase 2 family protein